MYIIATYVAKTTYEYKKQQNEIHVSLFSSLLLLERFTV